ncbi:MAG TPA: hypothetical protein VM285_09205 [Polyangia bacterium]|nr:hypothetical protein [Polyangia bacterium]
MALDAEGSADVRSGPRAQQPRAATITSHGSLPPDHALPRVYIIRLFPIPRNTGARLSFNIEIKFTQWIEKFPQELEKHQGKP